MYKFITRLAAPGIAVLCMLLASCESSSEIAAQVKPAIPVHIASPKVKDLPQYIESIGSLDHSFFVEIRPQINGTLSRILVQEGAWVELGTPLFEMDASTFRVKVDEAKAKLMVDQASYKAAKKKKERFESLAQKDLVSQIEWDEIEMQAAVALASIAGDKARLDAVTLDLEDCVIVAPSAGRIGRIDIHEGSIISPTMLLTTLSTESPLMVNFSITEKEFDLLPKRDLDIEVMPLCSGDTPHFGKLTFLDNRFDEKSGLLFARGRVDNSTDKLRAGQSVNVRIPFSMLFQALTIPLKAIRYNQQGPYVYVVSDENTVEFRQLVVSQEAKDEVVVLEGLQPHERVITSGNSKLSPGAKVSYESF